MPTYIYNISYAHAYYRYIWITGRVDDVINPSGHRIGTAEVESALVACPEVSVCTLPRCMCHMYVICIICTVVTMFSSYVIIGVRGSCGRLSSRS